MGVESFHHSSGEGRVELGYGGGRSGGDVASVTGNSGLPACSPGVMNMDRRGAGVLLAFLVCSQTTNAHDFWLQPQDFWMSPDTPISLTLQVGHGPFRQRSPIPLRRITRFVALEPTGSRLELKNS